MTESELIKITVDDISEANRLSLGCPICAGEVENNLDNPALRPVVCAKCQTLYHKTCWEQNGDKCAVLGCEHEECYPFGTEIGPRLVIHYSDLPKHAPRTPSPNGRFKELKEQQRRLQKEASRGAFWNNLYDRIKRAFGWR